MNAKDREKFDELFTMVEDIRDRLAGLDAVTVTGDVPDVTDPGEGGMSILHKASEEIVKNQKKFVVEDLATGEAKEILKEGPSELVEEQQELALGEVPVEESTPLTSAELAEFNAWLNVQLPLLDTSVLDPQKQIFNVLNKNGIRGLTEIGDNRDLLNKIKSDVEALPHA